VSWEIRVKFIAAIIIINHKLIYYFLWFNCSRSRSKIITRLASNESGFEETWDLLSFNIRNKEMSSTRGEIETSKCISPFNSLSTQFTPEAPTTTVTADLLANSFYIIHIPVYSSSSLDRLKNLSAPIFVSCKIVKIITRMKYCVYSELHFQIFVFRNDNYWTDETNQSWRNPHFTRQINSVHWCQVGN